MDLLFNAANTDLDATVHQALSQALMKEPLTKKMILSPHRIYNPAQQRNAF